jgi:hypothetical protein
LPLQQPAKQLDQPKNQLSQSLLDGFRIAFNTLHRLPRGGRELLLQVLDVALHLLRRLVGLCHSGLAGG